jgi:hypothetical protein
VSIYINRGSLSYLGLMIVLRIRPKKKNKHTRNHTTSWVGKLVLKVKRGSTGVEGSRETEVIVVFRVSMVSP